MGERIEASTDFGAVLDRLHVEDGDLLVLSGTGADQDTGALLSSSISKTAKKHLMIILLSSGSIERLSRDDALAALDLYLWGSDCSKDGGCDGNTTPGSMVCDSCRSDEFTVPLYAPLPPDDGYPDVLLG